MDKDRIVEIGARAYFDAAGFIRYGRSAPDWTRHLTEQNREQGRAEFRELLSRLSAAGLVVVDIGELKKLQLCKARLAAVTAWLEENRAEVFRHGLWDAVNAADEAEALKPAAKADPQ